MHLFKSSLKISLLGIGMASHFLHFIKQPSNRPYLKTLLECINTAKMMLYICLMKQQVEYFNLQPTLKISIFRLSVVRLNNTIGVDTPVNLSIKLIMMKLLNVMKCLC